MAAVTPTSKEVSTVSPTCPASGGSSKPESSKPLPACGFSVTGSKKGVVPVAVEKRPKGKKVTIISNVQGSAKTLVSTLSSLLGCGGTAKQQTSGIHWTVEIQGDQVERVGAALLQLGCLVGVKKDIVAVTNKKKPAVVASRDCGYDKFLRRPESSSNYVAPVLPMSECQKWHGWWPYCRGCCQQADSDDVWEDTLDGVREREPGGTTATTCMTAHDVNTSLHNLGMLSEVGSDVGSGRAKMRIFAGKIHTANTSVATGNHAAASTGMVSLDQYRRSAVAPGAHLIGEDAFDPAKERRAAAAAARRCTSTSARCISFSSSARIPKLKPPAKVGIYRCQMCDTAFGLVKTLRLHQRRVHGGEWKQPSGSGTAAPSACRGSSAVRSCSAVRSSAASSSRQRSSSAAPRKAWPSRSPSVTATHRLSHGSWVEEKDEEYAPPKRISWQISDSFPTLASPETQQQIPWGQPVRSSRASSLGPTSSKQSSKKSPCPICSKRFTLDQIEGHVEECLQAHPEDVDSGGDDPDSDVADDLAPTSVCSAWVVHTDFVPSGKGHETQIAVQRGDKVVVEWIQPETEGGHWVWGYRQVEPHAYGYIPIHNLEKAPPRDEEHTNAPYIPEDWLELFLLLDFDATVADSFWDEFGSLIDEMPKEDAWHLALGHACEKRAPDVEKRSKGAQYLIDGWGRASGGDCNEATDSEPKVALEGAVKEPAPELVRVRKAWVPVDPDNNQLEVSLGDLVLVEWRQPQAEGGYWAYGYFSGDASEERGYFPISSLDAPVNPASSVCSHGAKDEDEGFWDVAPTLANPQDGFVEPGSGDGSSTTVSGRSWQRHKHPSTGAVKADPEKLDIFRPAAVAFDETCDSTESVEAPESEREEPKPAKSRPVKPAKPSKSARQRQEPRQRGSSRSPQRSSGYDGIAIGKGSPENIASENIRVSRGFSPGREKLASNASRKKAAHIDSAGPRSIATPARANVVIPQEEMLTRVPEKKGRSENTALARSIVTAIPVPAVRLDQERAMASIRLAPKDKSCTRVAAMGVCPICSQEVPLATIEVHADSCFGQLATPIVRESPSFMQQQELSFAPAPPIFSSEELDQVRCWGESQFAARAARFCATRMCPSVAVASLMACTSSAETSSEALAFLGDNQVVRNFAAELWRRKSVAEGGGGAARSSEPLEQAPERQWRGSCVRAR